MNRKQRKEAPHPAISMNITSSQVSPLVQFAIRGLSKCWMPQHGRWSHIYHLDGRSSPNESIPPSDVFYTLNVLLGFSRLAHSGLNHGYELPKIFHENVSLMLKLDVAKYAYGMALWTGAELGLDIEGGALASIKRLIEDRQQWKAFRAQDIGMILIGCVAQARRAPASHWTSTAHNLFSFLTQNYTCPDGLFLDAAVGVRRAFSSFATNTYLALASYIYGSWSGNKIALALANSCALKLIELQGPQGEWPWFFYSPAGLVVDFYEVYSVHQMGMAPAFLEHAEQHSVPGATESLVRGFKWILGQNQMGLSMLRKRDSLVCRSQIRKERFGNRGKRMFRASFNAITRRSAKLIDPSKLQLRLECRSYELGWILWSFGSRRDLTEIQYHEDFRESGPSHPSQPS
jgi:hypothetical protein